MLKYRINSVIWKGLEQIGSKDYIWVLKRMKENQMQA